jgi:hypothetical protein
MKEKRSRTDRPKSTVLPSIALLSALALHSYQAFFDGSLDTQSGRLAFVAGLFAWSMFPYLLLSALFLRPAWKMAASLAALAVLLGDCWMHWAVFFDSTSSTAVLGLLWMPPWNLLLVGPGALLAIWLAKKIFRRAPPSQA